MSKTESQPSYTEAAERLEAILERISSLTTGR